MLSFFSFSFYRIYPKYSDRHPKYLGRHITKTCLYNFYPLKPQFYIVKLGFTGYTLFFLFLLKNKYFGYSLEPPQRGGSNEYHNPCFEQKYEKYLIFFYLIFFQFLEVRFSIYLNRRVFVMRRRKQTKPLLHIGKKHIN